MPNNGFVWRPNDNSARTNLRYTLEAQKWVNAVSSAQRKGQPRSISEDLAFIGMVFELILSVTLLILLGLLQLVKGLVQLIETGIQNHKTKIKDQETEVKAALPESAPPTEWNFKKEPDAVWNFKKEKEYPTGWQLIFFTSWGRLRHIWQFLYLLVSIFIIIVAVLWLLSLWIPDYVNINKEVLIFAGIVSLWNAFLGVED